jgi:hypothetical protein
MVGPPPFSPGRSAPPPVPQPAPQQGFPPGPPPGLQPGPQPAAIPALVPLFAPYCGGLGREQDLGAALAILAAGQLQGARRLSDGGAHAFALSWGGDLAPRAALRCQLRFPELPAVTYTFALPCHQLVEWLMEGGAEGLPESFWPWLLQGRLPPRPA